MWMIFLLYALFGTVFTAAKSGLAHAEPFFLVGFRMLLAGILMLLWISWKKKDWLRINSDQLGRLLLMAVFNIYITNGFEFWGMKYLTSSKTSFIYSMSPFFAALLSRFMLGERLSFKKQLGLVIGFIGFIPILWKQTLGEEGLASLGFFSVAELAVMFAAFATVYGWIIMRGLVAEGMSPIAANAYSMLFGGVFSLIHSALTETWNPLPVNGSWVVTAETIGWMIVVSNFICYNLYGFLLKKYTVTLMSFVGFSTPFFAAFFSWIMLGEVVHWSFFLSAGIVFAGLILFYQEEIQRDGLMKKTRKSR